MIPKRSSHPHFECKTHLAIDCVQLVEELCEDCGIGEISLLGDESSNSSVRTCYSSNFD